MTPAAVWLAS